jgi:electron transfer flavoprotein alpha subunit
VAVAEGRPGPISDATIDAMAEAARLAGELGAEADAIVLGHCDDELAGSLGPQGATRVFAAAAGDAPLHDADTYVPFLVDLISKHEPAVVLYAAAALGREVAARVAARLNVGLASDCTELSVGPDGLLRMSRAVYGGRASCTVVCPRARPQMATLQSRPSAARASTPGREPQVIRMETSRAAAPRTEVEGLIQGDPRTMDLAEADVIVAGGRGVGSREGFELLVELASLLGGAVAASRVAVDAGWLPSHRQVGQSGRTVAPSLYVACGISGAPHHTVGMREAGAVVAINTDSRAPIFDLADMALVGDVREVLPPVLARLRKTKSEAPSPGATVFGALAQSFEDGK